MHKTVYKKHERGYALFFAIMIAGIIAVIAFSVSNIIRKEAIITGVVGESQSAIYAADAGLECALYWDSESEECGSIFYCIPVSEGLVGHWMFDEGEGTTALDSSVNTNHGELINLSDWESGVFGSALEFHGTDDEYVNLPHSVLDGKNDVTATFWIKTSVQRSQSIISGANNSSNNQYLIFFPDHETIRFYYNSPVTFDIPSIDDGAWHHFAVVRDAANNKVRLYMDGNSVGSKNHTLDPLEIANDGLVIGQDQDIVGGGFAANQSLEGLLDDVRIYDRVLTSAEVGELYNSTDQGGLVGEDSGFNCNEEDITNSSTGWMTETGGDPGWGDLNGDSRIIKAQFDMLFDGGSSNPFNPCATVSVEKDIVAGTTTISSFGYNTCEPGNTHRVERSFRARY